MGSPYKASFFFSYNDLVICRDGLHGAKDKHIQPIGGEHLITKKRRQHDRNILERTDIVLSLKSGRYTILFGSAG
jgi:hypothetical protein